MVYFFGWWNLCWLAAAIFAQGLYTVTSKRDISGILLTVFALVTPCFNYFSSYFRWNSIVFSISCWRKRLMLALKMLMMESVTTTYWSSWSDGINVNYISDIRVRLLSCAGLVLLVCRPCNRRSQLFPHSPAPSSLFTDPEHDDATWNATEDCIKGLSKVDLQKENENERQSIPISHLCIFTYFYSKWHLHLCCCCCFVCSCVHWRFIQWTCCIFSIAVCLYFSLKSTACIYYSYITVVQIKCVLSRCGPHKTLNKSVLELMSTGIIMIENQQQLLRHL